MSEFLIGSLGILGGIVVALVDGRRAVAIAALAAGIALAPAALVVGGGRAATIPLVAALATALALLVARVVAERFPTVPGLDPLVPVVSPPTGLFGPRSLRAVAIALALPVTSWVSTNVTVGGAASARGVIFTAVYIWLAGAVRLLLGRTVEDLACGAAAIALAGGVSWTVQADMAPGPPALAIAAVAPLAGAVAGWLTGRHHRGRRSRTVVEVSS